MKVKKKTKKKIELHSRDSQVSLNKFNYIDIYGESEKVNEIIKWRTVKDSGSCGDYQMIDDDSKQPRASSFQSAYRIL